MKRLSALFLVLFFGCMQPDSPSGPDAPADSGVKDQDLLAGATSTTNWPPEDVARRPYKLQGYSDSVLVLKFVDSVGTRVKMTGRMILYKAGTIPAFDAPDSISVPFSDIDSVKVWDGLLQGLNADKDDSLSFSVMVEFDTIQSFVVGFTFSTKLKKFLQSPFSAEPNFSPLVSSRHYAIEGVPDSSLANMGFPIEGKTKLCFYIPGSPFFFKVNLDTTIRVGLLPQGKYPLRLLRVTKIDGQTNQDQLEVYEVKVIDSPIDSMHHESFKIIGAGKKIFTSLLKSSISIRPD